MAFKFNPFSGKFDWFTKKIKTFLGLDDTSSSYSEQAGKVVKVKATEDGLEFEKGAAGVSTFHGIRVSLAQNTTRYFYIGDASASPTENLAQAALPAGTLKAFYLRVEANTLNVAATFTVRLDGVDTALTITVPAGNTGVYQIVTDVSVTDEQLYSLAGIAPIGSGTINCHPLVFFQANI